MARTYIAVPVDPALATGALASVAKAHSESPEEARERGYIGPPRVLRLKDKASTGPSVAQRLAAVEERLDSYSKCLAAVEDFATELRNAENTMTYRIGNLESDVLDLRTRISDLERLPVASARMSDRAERDRLFLLRDRAVCGCLFADCTKHGAFYYATEAERLEAKAIAEEYRSGVQPVASPPATTEPTPSGAAEDRLAKVATDDDLLDLFERSEYASGDTRAARRALYNLGREHGRAERDALLARAEKAERETSPIAKIHERLVNDCVSAIQPYIRAGFGEGDLAGIVRCVVADWQKRGAELAALRSDCANISEEMGTAPTEPRKPSCADCCHAAAYHDDAGRCCDADACRCAGYQPMLAEGETLPGMNDQETKVETGVTHYAGATSNAFARALAYEVGQGANVNATKYGATFVEWRTPAGRLSIEADDGVFHVLLPVEQALAREFGCMSLPRAAEVARAWLGRKAAAAETWNWCGKCSQPVDCDDAHEGGEVRCLGCNTIYVGASWVLA